jgi:hypothetical protein
MMGGKYVSFRSERAPQIMIGTDGTGDRRLTSEADGITLYLSGDGTVSYAVTGYGD